jgi:hypothetical protein
MNAIQRSALYAFLLSLLSITTSSAFVFQTYHLNAREVDGDVVPRPQLPPPQQQGPGLPPLPPLPDVSQCEIACNHASADAITAINAMEAELLANATTPAERQSIRALILFLIGVVYDSWRLCLLACGVPIEVVLLIISVLL